MKFFFLFTLTLIFFVKANAQEFLTSIKYNPQLNQAAKRAGTHPKYRGADTLLLPFFDDFSKPEVFPDPNLWISNGVFVNTTYPANPVSIGVATFDGLNQFGIPYETTGSTAAENADTLTSLPIHMERYKASDSLYLSFFYEAQGYGDYPNKGDSIILQFKKFINDTTFEWVNVWSKDGPDTSVSVRDQSFRQVMIPIADSPAYFYRGFQFMFHNIATASGKNDDWHIDYVRIDTLRSISDTTVNDVAIAYIPTTILKNYQQMPWSQFEASELATSNTMHVRNNFSSVKNTSYSYNAREIYSATPLSAPPAASVNIQALSNDSVAFNTFSINATPPHDSALVSIKYTINATSDVVPQNDTVTRFQDFFNYYAYDDGSAEAAYALTGTGAKLADKFHTNKPDTLRAIQISFTSIEDQIDQLLMTLLVWKSLTPTEVIQHQTPFVFPTYVDSINGFYTYVLDTPMAINGDFYIGFQQSAADFIYVGEDENTDSHKNIYYNTVGAWQQSSIAGSLLMRPLIGKPLPYQFYTGVKPVVNSGNLIAYPNPVKDQLNVRISSNKPAAYSIIDCTGRTILHSKDLTPSINVSSLADGLYLLKVDEVSGSSYLSKFIKLH